MLIWLLILVFFLLLGVIGYFIGTVRTLISIAGMIVGAMLALPLAPKVTSWVPAAWHPVWHRVLPPVYIFLLVSLAFSIIGFVIHWRLQVYYKFRRDEIQQLQWKRLDHRLGACLGFVMATGYVLLIGAAVYVLGYASVQVSAGESDPPALRYLNQARYDLEKTGLDKVVAPLASAPPSYYEASDAIGMIYQNPLLHNRLSNYPPFLGMSDRPEFQEIANDQGVISKLQTKASIIEILNEPKIQAIINNPEIVDQFRQVNLKDLQDYLKTGKSPKYYDEKILGRWEIDSDSMIVHMRKMKPNITASELLALKRAAAALAGTTLTALVDGRMELKVKIVGAVPAAPKPAENAEPQESEADRIMRQRYGRTGSGRSSAPPAARRPNTPGLPSPTAALPVQITSGQGQWVRDGDHYKVTFKDERGQTLNWVGNADDEALTLANGPRMLFFLRAE